MPSYKYTNAAGRVLWFCSFYYQDYNGKRFKKKKQGFATKREADAWERDYLAKKTGSPSMTFSQLAENYLADAAARVKPTTAQEVSKALHRCILPTFGDMPIDTITPAAVRQWVNDLLATGAALGSIAEYKNVFSRVMRFACRFYGLASNPVAAAGPVKAGGRVQEEKRIRVWTQEQFARFILSGLQPEYIALFSTLFWTGARIGEVIALTVADIDFHKKEISITKDVEPLDGRRYRAQTPKTPASIRRVSMPVQLAEILRDWIRVSEAVRPSDMLFHFKDRSSANNMLHEGAARVGLPAISVHDLRHSHASMLVHLGFAPIVIRDRLGHKDIQTTLNIYSHLYPSVADTVAARLSAMNGMK